MKMSSLSLFGDDDDDDNNNNNNSLRPKENGVLSFHNGTEEALILFVSEHIRNHNLSQRDETVSERCQYILSCIDNYCYNRHWMMHIGLSLL